MLKTILSFCLFCIFTNVCKSQSDKFVLTIDNLPVDHSWYFDTVNDQGKDIGHSSGKKNELYTLSPSILDYCKVIKRSGDTTSFGGQGVVSIVFDISAPIFRKVSYYYNYNVAAGPQILYSFSAADVHVIEVNNMFTADLFADDILGHGLDFSASIQWGPIDGGGIYTTDNYYSLGISDVATHIHIEISKQDLLGIPDKYTKISVPEIYPNPASNMLNIRPSDPQVPLKVMIGDLMGRNIYTYSLHNSDNLYNIDISDIPPGLYWVRAGNRIQKLVIAR
jgi:hypothetical protein